MIGNSFEIMIFANKLNYYRTKNKLTLSRAAKLTGISYSYLKKAEQGVLVPGFHYGHLIKLSALYGIAPHDFF